jgi:hypothetical protein
MSKTSWKKLVGKSYLTGEDLGDKEVTLTINEVSLQEVRNQKGKENKPVATFVGTEMKLVLNVTNLRTIARNLGSKFIEDWAGQQITLIPKKGRFFGEQQTVVRIKSDKSKIL